MTDAAVGLFMLGAVLGANLVLLRPLFEPLQRLAGLMRQIDLLRPGQRLGVAGKGEIAVLGSTFNDMRARLETRRQESVTQTLTAQEEERRRIARNLHDEVGQNLTAVLLQLDRLGRRVRPELQGEFEETVESVRSSLDDAEASRAELRLDRVPGGVVLRVADNGRGLPHGMVGSSVGGLGLSDSAAEPRAASAPRFVRHSPESLLPISSRHVKRAAPTTRSSTAVAVIHRPQ